MNLTETLKKWRTYLYKYVRLRTYLARYSKTRLSWVDLVRSSWTFIWNTRFIASVQKVRDPVFEDANVEWNNGVPE